MNPRKLATLSVVALVALAVPFAVAADTVYFRLPGVHGLQSATGTIVQDEDGVLKITTDDGQEISIDRGDVYQIVRDAPPAAPSVDDAHESRPDGETPSLGLHRPKSRSSYQLGIIGGMNVSNMSVDPQEFEDSNSLRSYAVGAWLRTALSRRVMIQTEALYSVKGDSESAGGYTASTRMTYIDVPILARIGFRRRAAIRPSLFLGPSMAFNLTANSKLEGGDTDIDVDVKDRVRAFDVGFVVGGGLDFVMGHRSYGVDIRYSKGLTNAVGDNANGTARNDVLAVLGSIRFQ